MYKITQSILGAAMFLFASSAIAQVGIGTTTPNTDAELDITSTTRGVLLPRLALTGTANTAPLTAHVAGMIAYNNNTAGDVTPGFYYNNGTQWVRIGAGAASNDWTLLGNAGTTAGTNFIGTTDAVDFVTRTNNAERMRVLSDGRVSVNNATPFTTGNLVSHTTTANHAIAAESTGSGHGLYIEKTDAGQGILVLGQNNAAGGIFSDLRTNVTDGDDAVIGHANNNAGFGGGWFLNATTGNKGPGRGTAELGYGILGMANGGGDGNTGVYGSASSGSKEGSGVYGAMTNGSSSVAGGALAYRLAQTGNGPGTYYGGYFWDQNAGADHTDGTGRMASTTDTRPRVNVGFGSIGGLMGGWSKGDVYGMATKGDRFSLYVHGRQFTNKTITQLSNSTHSERIATYVSTSTSIDITSKGIGKLNNGRKRIAFEKNFSALSSSKDPIIVTVTPLGKSNGVYIESVDTNGFTIVENNNGQSNVNFSWIAIANKKGEEETTNTPKELLASDYDEKLDRFMKNEAVKNSQRQEMWWDGSEIKFSNTPAPKSYTKSTNVTVEKK